MSVRKNKGLRKSYSKKKAGKVPAKQVEKYLWIKVFSRVRAWVT
jgi:hypothetical protein